jgi:flagellar motor protein MotB
VSDDGLSEEAGEGYFASISDLMIGVLFVFLLMMTVFALNFRDDTTQLDQLKLQAQQAEKAATEAKRRATHDAQAAASARRDAERAEAAALVQQMQADMLQQQNDELRARLREAATTLQRELRDREAARAVLLQRLAERLDASGIKFTIDQRSGVLRLSDAIPFAVGRSDLGDPTAAHTVQVLGRVLATVLPCFATDADRHDCDATDAPILETVLVEGHTDSQPFPNMTPAQSEQENDRLSAARALTVFTALRQQDAVLDALRNPSGQPLLGISGYGQRRPLPDAVSSAQADLTRNRRIDLRFVLASRTSEEVQRLLDRIAGMTAASTPMSPVP